MSSYLWLRPLAHRLLGRPARRASSTRSAVSSWRRVRPCLEILEDRITPTNNTFTPTVLTDGVSSGGQIKTLRDAINASNSDGFTIPDHTDTIQLGSGTYTLNQGQLSINAENHNLIIQGQGTTGPNATIIKQTAADRVFLVDDSNGNPEQIIFKDLVIEGGDAQVDGAVGPNVAAGGGILAKSGEVTLSNVVVRSNAARAGAGNNAQGGGIYMVNGDVHFNASLTIQNSIVADNNAFVGAGGLAQGGGVFGSGPFNISISNSSVSSNGAHGDNPSGDGGSAEGGGVFGTGCSISISGLSHLSLNVVEGGTGASGGAAAGGGVFGNQCTISISESGLTSNVVKGGSGSNGGGGVAEGGGVFGNQCDLTLSDSDLSGNTLTGGSGVITGSTADPGDVGGAAEGGGVWASGTTSITGGTMSDNFLTGGNGTLNNSSASVTGDVGGEALGGGAVVGGKSANITTTVFGINNLTGGNGTYDAGTVKGTVGGSAAGGGVYVSTSGGTTPVIDMSNSTLSGNFVFGGNGSGGTASPGFASGGGARFEAGSTGDLVNTTIADNQAIGGPSNSLIPVAAGGGLFFDSKSSGNLTNVTVVGNQASPSATGQGSTSGGGIDNGGGTVRLVNTLVALNGANKGPDFAGTVTNSENNLISVADGSSGFSAANGDQLGSELHFLNPVIGSLANNGGPTQTIALLAGSPAINAGDSNAESVTGKFDQRGEGFTRVAFGDIDIGAFEVQPPKVAPPLVVKPPPTTSPAAPPTLHTPSLLAFLDSLLGEVETGNSNGTWTVTDSLFGIPLLVSTYGSAGNLMSVTLFGIDVTFLFESL